MKQIVHCNQYYPWAGKNDPCSGQVFHVYTNNKSRDGYSEDKTEYDGGLVCEGHMKSYEELADRTAEYRGFIIVRKEVVGTIGTAEGGASVSKEVLPE